MRLKLSKERALRSADYLEMLDMISTKSFAVGVKTAELISPKIIGRTIIMNPEYYSKDYDKTSDERVFIKCCCIRFSYNQRVYRVNGETHTDCAKRSCSIFNTAIEIYERGFSLSNYEFISCEDAPSFIRNYKKHTIATKIDNYSFNCIDNKISLVRDSELELEGCIQKTLLKEQKHIYLLNITYYKYAKIYTPVVCSVNFTKKKLSLYGLKNPFSFRKRRRISFDIN